MVVRRDKPFCTFIWPEKTFAAFKRGTTLVTISSEPFVTASAPDAPTDIVWVHVFADEQV